METEDAMPRAEARLFSAIWAQEDWRKLSPGAQWSYLMLISQSDLAQDGVISLREGRWARLANGVTATDMRERLSELASASWVVIDEDTGELLVRSLIRWDRVFMQPNVMRAAISHLVTVESRTIRRVIYTELMRIIRENSDEVRTERGEKPLTGEQKNVIARAVSALRSSGDAVDLPGGPEGSLESFEEGSENPSRKGSLKGFEEGSPNPLGDRGKGKGAKDLGSSRASAHPRTPAREAAALFPPPPAGQAVPMQRLFDEFWQAYPRREGKQAALKAWGKAVEKTNPSEIITGARKYADDPNREAAFTAHPSTWLNAGRWEDEPLPPRSTGRTGRPDADARVRAGLELAAQFRAEREAAQQSAPQISGNGWQRPAPTRAIEESWG